MSEALVHRLTILQLASSSSFSSLSAIYTSRIADQSASMFAVTSFVTLLIASNVLPASAFFRLGTGILVQERAVSAFICVQAVPLTH